MSRVETEDECVDGSNILLLLLKTIQYILPFGRRSWVRSWFQTFPLRAVAGRLPFGCSAPRLPVSARLLETQAFVVNVDQPLESVSDTYSTSLTDTDASSHQADSLVSIRPASRDSFINLNGFPQSTLNAAEENSSSRSCSVLPIPVHYVGQLPTVETPVFVAPPIYTFDCPVEDPSATLPTVYPSWIPPNSCDRRTRRIIRRCDRWITESVLVHMQKTHEYRPQPYGDSSSTEIATDCASDVFYPYEMSDQLSFGDSASQQFVASALPPPSRSTTADSERIRQLEEELEKLHSQLAQLVLAQERANLGDKNTQDNTNNSAATTEPVSFRLITVKSVGADSEVHRLDGDGESDPGSSCPTQPTISVEQPAVTKVDFTDLAVPPRPPPTPVVFLLRLPHHHRRRHHHPLTLVPIGWRN
ncbi:mitochondrial fission regulator 1 [Sparganum proliferum]